MKPEKQRLIDDLLASGSRRENTLRVGAKILRRRRVWRATRPPFILAIILAFSTVTIWLTDQKNQPTQLAQISKPETNPSTPPPVKFLTDDELLALFPNTPVGLITLHNGKKILYFPRASDRAKFVARSPNQYPSTD